MYNLLFIVLGHILCYETAETQMLWVIASCLLDHNNSKSYLYCTAYGCYGNFCDTQTYVFVLMATRRTDRYHGNTWKK